MYSCIRLILHILSNWIVGIDGYVKTGFYDPSRDKLDAWLKFWVHLYSHSLVIWNRDKWETLCPTCLKNAFLAILKPKKVKKICKTRHLFLWGFKLQLTFTIIALKVYHYNSLRSFKNVRSEICPSTLSKHQSYQFTSNYRCNVYGHLS